MTRSAVRMPAHSAKRQGAPQDNRRVLVALAGIVCAVAVAYAVFTLTEGRRAPASIGPQTLANRMMVENVGGASGSKTLFKIEVPEGASELHFSLAGGKGAADIYLRFGTAPALDSFDVMHAGTEQDKLVSISKPEAGTYYLLVHGANGAYSGHALTASYAPRGSVFKVGMHAHRLYNGGDWDGPESDAPKFQYGIIRDWDISHLQDAAVWKSDDTINFKRIEKVYDGHARHGAKVIKTFGTVPTWASKRPAEPNKQYPNWPGAKSGPRNLDHYEDYVFRFVSRMKERLWAVEGWNEPYACPGDPTEFTTMTPTELADVQKRVYRATKRADPKILVFSPAQAYVCGIPTVLNAHTSDGEPIHRFFDAVAWHPYNRSASGNAGPSLAREAGQVRRHMTKAGLKDMQLVNTEHGWLEPPKEGGREFHALTDAQKGQVLYDTAKVAKSIGLLAIVWYGYDNTMIGKPMTSAAISRRLQQMYDDLNTP